MEGEAEGNQVLDFAKFDITLVQNRFDVTAYRKGVAEKIATGSLDQLTSHLPEANNCHSKGLGSFRLELNHAAKDFSWFTKFTLSSFLSLVCASELLKNASMIKNEILQLEDSRKFHLSLYAKDLPSHLASMLGDGEDSKEEGLKDKDDTSNATKNELLCALDVRLIALKKDLYATLSQVLGAYSTRQISDLAAFCQYFGAADIRDLLLKYLELGVREPTLNSIDDSLTVADDIMRNQREIADITSHPVLMTNTLKSVRTGVSPAKIAKAERQSSSESEGSSDSSDNDQLSAERSRPLIRSASPRRSASPMRRVQIGRSGSRRPTALTIKSLSHIPARERIYSDADGKGSGDEVSEQPSTKTESSVRRMSVQDAINLFESKQRDQSSNIQGRKAFGEISASTNKSVLRRWSAGMGEASKQSTQVNSSHEGLQGNSKSPILEADDMTVSRRNVGSDMAVSGLNKTEDIVDKASASEDMVTSYPVMSSVGLDVPKTEEIQEKPTDAAEWTRQKEAELNQMLMKLMESKPSKYKGTTSGASGNLGRFSERKSVPCKQSKEKRSEKPQVVANTRQTGKEAQFKMTQETLDERRGKIASKGSALTSKQDALGQRTRRNSSPPVLSKKEVPKSASSRKPTLRTSSPADTTRGSWTSTPSTRTAGTPTSRASPVTANKAATVGRKLQSSPSPSSLTPKPKRILPQSMGNKGTQNDVKIPLKNQEDKKHNLMASRGIKAKNLSPSGNDSVPAKSSFKAKKSTVVPLESKSFLRKGTNSSRSVGPEVPKAPNPSDDSSRTSGNLVLDEEVEFVSKATEAISQLPEDLADAVSSDDKHFEDIVDNAVDDEVKQSINPVVEDISVVRSTEFSYEENINDEDVDICSAAWVEIEHQGILESCGRDVLTEASDIVPLPSSSPRVRHSLSQMLQADNGEPEILEWGNAENPPALIYQKDAPKGLKRLLKFARKSREVNLAGWSSPSVFSEGEEDAEDGRSNKRSNDDLLQRSSIQTQSYGKQKTKLSESYDGGFKNKRSTDHLSHQMPSGQSGTTIPPSSNSKLREGHLSTSNKATRSFFSLSTFRSSKSGETKLR